MRASLLVLTFAAIASPSIAQETIDQVCGETRDGGFELLDTEDWAALKEEARQKRASRPSTVGLNRQPETTTLAIKQSPIPNYPLSALENREIGACVILHNVSEKGKPRNVKAACTTKTFVRSAKSAIKKMRYEPVLVDGTPVSLYGVEFPLNFCMG
ncbi:MAG: energy transducer TonB [Pseudomonadota bacterium]